MDALDKVKSTLDLKDPEAHDNDTTETAISFHAVWLQFEEHLPEFFTWDNLFDVLLFQTVSSQFIFDLHGQVGGLDEHSGMSQCYDGEESANISDAVLQVNTGIAPLTNTVTILSDPVMKKNFEDDIQHQVQWSDSSDSQDKEGEILEVDEDTPSSDRNIANGATTGDFKFSFAANVNAAV